MDTLFVDGDTAQVLREVIWKRFQRERGCPGIRHGFDDHHGEFYAFLVGDRVFVEVQVYVDSHGGPGACNLRVYDGPDKPTAYVEIYEDTVGFDGLPEDQYERTIEMIKVRVAHGAAIPFKLHVPYGFVEDDTIIAIWYVLLRQGNVQGSIHPRMSEFVLGGHEVPEALLKRGGDTATYMRECWELVRRGQILEIGDRITSHPTTLWLRATNPDHLHLTFDHVDEQHPRLIANTPYLLHLLADHQGRIQQVTRRFQVGDNLPKNMSEFFTEYM